MSESAIVPHTSRMAVWSMVLGIIGFATVCVLIGLPLAIVGLVLGIVALAQIGKPGKPPEGKPYAITGIVASGITLVAGPLMVIPLMIGILLPALGAARQTAMQMQGNTQARGIQQARVMWGVGQPANPQTGNSPLTDDLWTLVDQQYFTLEYAVSPMVNTPIPPDYDTWPADQQRRWLAANSSFVLVPGLEDDLDADKIALFGKPDHFGGNGIPVAYNDHRVQFVITANVAQVDAQLQLQTGKSMQQLIDESEALP